MTLPSSTVLRNRTWKWRPVRLRYRKQNGDPNIKPIWAWAYSQTHILAIIILRNFICFYLFILVEYFLFLEENNGENPPAVGGPYTTTQEQHSFVWHSPRSTINYSFITHQYFQRKWDIFVIKENGFTYITWNILDIWRKAIFLGL